jgi:hypothetical protein
MVMICYAYTKYQTLIYFFEQASNVDLLIYGCKWEHLLYPLKQIAHFKRAKTIFTNHIRQTAIISHNTEDRENQSECIELQLQ